MKSSQQKTAEVFWDIPNNLKYDEPIDETSPFFVDTAVARGNFSFNRIYRSLFLDPVDLDFKSNLPQRVYQLLYGHRGCGKSTELRRLSHKLDHPQRFFVVFVDVPSVLDINNLRYADTLFALAAALLTKLQGSGISLAPEYLQALENWFADRVEKHETTKDFSADVKTQVKAGSGLPFLVGLFAEITTAFRVNSQYKEELRHVLTNSFSQFAAAFNTLIAATEAQLPAYEQGRCLLFIVDGTDRLNQDDGKRFFIDDVHQLQQIEGNFLYCAPIQLLHEGGQVYEAFNAIPLPMAKLREKHDATPHAEAYAVMREMAHKRVAAHLFDGEATLDYLIEHSGGNPRHLLRLLDYAFQDAENHLLDRPAAEKAVKRLANELRRILDTEDYALLAKIDRSDEEVNDGQVRRLLYNLALLEYNDYWRMSHPAVRTLPAYQAALAAA